MNTFFIKALDWSEVWTLLIPLSVLLLHRKQPGSLKPVILYLWIALAINLVIDVIMEVNVYFHSFLTSNNPYYNIHSVIRFSCFSIYFIKLPQPHFSIVKKILVGLFIAFLIINFGFFENFFNPNYLSGNLMSAESYLLLVYCMLYYLSELKSEHDLFLNRQDFWVVTGLSIYVVINFFVFLFYVPMLNANPVLADNMWYVHNFSVIIFCLFLTKGLYATTGYKYTN